MIGDHMIRGVLFDLDGVIVDTLHYHYLAWKHMFEKYGGSSPVTELSTLLHEGRNSREILPMLMKEAGVNHSRGRTAGLYRGEARLLSQHREGHHLSRSL